VSSDPTRPGPEWWQQQQGPQDNAGYQGNAGYQKRPDYGPGSQETRQFPVDQGQETQIYPNQHYQGMRGTQGRPAAAGYGRRRRRRWPWITLIVILLLLVAVDRGANAYAEDQMASQFQSSLGLSGKPHVSIAGFPFLTQAAARDFRTVNITASNETINTKSTGSGLLEIASLNATLHGMHIKGLKSATIDQFNASALITFTALGNVGGIPQGITLSADGPNQVKASIDILGVTDDAVAKVTQVGTNKINVQVTDFGGIPSDVLGNLSNFTITIPKLPAGVSIQNVSVTQQGLRITAAGQNTTFSQ
jgi:hypothetical protein